ncbi:MAG: hypothetical protein J0G96_13600 [Flavobacteriia bacterium]|nr:hypothetical protein [Flavobacteriia bacterium]OJX39779.1 MAG: hypothetical protein BGO87_02145 [Flavobacteriia bacterium 40-80]
MKYTYHVKEKDFLNFQLFHLSQAEEFKARLRKQRLSIMLLNIAFGIFFALEKKFLITSIFVTIGILWFFLYPNRIKRIYKKRFQNEIQEKYQQHFGVDAAFEINETTLKTVDKGGFSEKRYDDILKIVHLPEATYIIFKNKQTFILPQDATENYDSMKNELSAKAQQMNITVQDLPDWKF